VSEFSSLHALAHALGVATEYTDGLGRSISVATETLIRVCRALGAELEHPRDAATALVAHLEAQAARTLPPVVVAWNGVLPPLKLSGPAAQAAVVLDSGVSLPLRQVGGRLGLDDPLPFGEHRLLVDMAGQLRLARLLVAPSVARDPAGENARGWGVLAHVPSLRSSRSRAIGDLQDLTTLARWLRAQGAGVLSVLPLLPTYNTPPVECSPYAPVSRLFWSEAMLDLGARHHPIPGGSRLDFQQADREVRQALADHAVPDAVEVPPELLRYAMFRGAQRQLGRDWRRWPGEAAGGVLDPRLVDREEARFHLIAQRIAAAQIASLRGALGGMGMRLALDLAVGVHPDGYDAWSRQSLFADGMTVGAPPDAGFPSGQDWGFPPLLPAASQSEGHAYLASCLAHQMAAAQLLRLDHIMSFQRLYWIPQGAGVGEGTYVSYPMEELLAVLLLASHRHRTSLIGEDLGTVPLAIHEAMAQHRIPGMFVAEFAAGGEPVPEPTARQVAYVETHDTPPLAGWVAGKDLEERVHHGLLSPSLLAEVRQERLAAIRRLRDKVEARATDDGDAFLVAVLAWLGRSASPLVMFWLEDLWGEKVGINLPGTSSSARANWQRPMRVLLDEMRTAPSMIRVLKALDTARRAPASGPDACAG